MFIEVKMICSDEIDCGSVKSINIVVDPLNSKSRIKKTWKYSKESKTGEKIVILIIGQFVNNLWAHFEKVHCRVCRAPIEIIVIGLQWATGEIEQVVGIFVTPARGLKFR